jgi:hypothetical protein
VALSGMGNCHLTVANYWLGEVDAADEESSDAKTELNEEETKASEQLTSGKLGTQCLNVDIHDEY